MTSPDYGIQAFLFWRPEVADRDLGLIQDAGFRWVKQEFAWREIEGAGKGVFNWDNTDRMMQQIDQYGLKIIARVGVQPEWAGGNYLIFLRRTTIKILLIFYMPLPPDIKGKYRHIRFGTSQI